MQNQAGISVQKMTAWDKRKNRLFTRTDLIEKSADLRIATRGKTSSERIKTVSLSSGLQIDLSQIEIMHRVLGVLVDCFRAETDGLGYHASLRCLAEAEIGLYPRCLFYGACPFKAGKGSEGIIGLQQGYSVCKQFVRIMVCRHVLIIVQGPRIDQSGERRIAERGTSFVRKISLQEYALQTFSIGRGDLI